MNTKTDTFELAKILKSSDFSQLQTEALVEVVRSIDEKNRADLVTKDYFEAKLYMALFIHGIVMVATIVGAASAL